jgi:hypothetical protein
METFFKLPVKKILKDENESYISYHYTYYSGKSINNYKYEYEIMISHIKSNGKHYLSTIIIDNTKNKSKEFKIQTITNNTLNKLQDRIDTYLSKLDIYEKFVNSWQKSIDKKRVSMENNIIIEINNNEITQKNGEKYTMFDWQIGKTKEELNEEMITHCLETIKSYQEYINKEDN